MVLLQVVRSYIRYNQTGRLSGSGSEGDKMYTELERMAVTKVTSALPPVYREQRDQFARSLPLLALLSVVFVAVLGASKGISDRLMILSIDPLGGPAIGPEPQYRVVRKRKLGRSVDRDRVVVVEHDQLVEAEVPSE